MDSKWLGVELSLLIIVSVVAVGGFVSLTSDSDATGQASLKSILKKVRKAQVQIEKQFSCMDSDGGKSFGKPGVTRGVRAWWDITLANVKEENDVCTTICEGSVGSGVGSSGPCLIEYYCSSHPQKGGPVVFAAFEVKKCESGCQNGACVGAAPQPVPAQPPVVPQPPAQVPPPTVPSPDVEKQQFIQRIVDAAQKNAQYFEKLFDDAPSKLDAPQEVKDVVLRIAPNVKAAAFGISWPDSTREYIRYNVCKEFAAAKSRDAEVFVRQGTYLVQDRVITSVLMAVGGALDKEPVLLPYRYKISSPISGPLVQVVASQELARAVRAC